MNLKLPLQNDFEHRDTTVFLNINFTEFVLLHGFIIPRYY
jgi:hypothetical protein